MQVLCAMMNDFDVPIKVSCRIIRSSYSYYHVKDGNWTAYKRLVNKYNKAKVNIYAASENKVAQ